MLEFLFFNNMMDWKMQAGTSVDGNRINMEGGLNINSTSTNLRELGEITVSEKFQK